MRNILLSIDSDKDDLYMLCIMIAQSHFKKINIIGIIIEDGFLTYPQNISIVDFFINNILKYPGIDIYKGLIRNSYLTQERDFPEVFRTGFFDEMYNNFGYDYTVNPTNYKELAELKIKLLNYNSIYVLSTGNMTSLPSILNDINIKPRIKQIYSMIGNYNVDGNIIYIESNPTYKSDAEYNAFLDPDSFSIMAKTNYLNIIPLDCTNYAPFVSENIETIKLFGLNDYNICNNEFIKNLYNNFLLLLESSVSTVDDELYFWDLVTALIFLEMDIEQKSIEKNIYVSWTGKI